MTPLSTSHAMATLLNTQAPPPTQSLVYNALYSEPIQAGDTDTYFEFTIEQGQGMSVGLTTKDLFKPGYKIRGALYNGNLTNGGGSKVTGFGPRIKKGDVVGVLASVQNGEVTITFYINNSCLGTGFKIPLPQGNLQPMVGLHKPGDKVSVVSVTPPADRSRNNASGPFPQGAWKVKTFQNEEVAFDVTVTFEAHPNALAMIAKVVNILKTSLVPQEGGIYKPSGNVITTMMAGPEDEMAFETKFVQFMEGVNSIEETTQGGRITAANGVTAELVAKTISFKPVIENVLKA